MSKEFGHGVPDMGGTPGGKTGRHCQGYYSVNICVPIIQKRPGRLKTFSKDAWGLFLFLFF